MPEDGVGGNQNQGKGRIQRREGDELCNSWTEKLEPVPPSELRTDVMNTIVINLRHMIT